MPRGWSLFPLFLNAIRICLKGDKYRVGTSRRPPAPACPLPRARRGQGERRAGVAVAAAVPGAAGEAAPKAGPADAAPPTPGPSR